MPVDDNRSANDNINNTYESVIKIRIDKYPVTHCTYLTKITLMALEKHRKHFEFDIGCISQKDQSNF